jgi:hypothetical protein
MAHLNVLVQRRSNKIIELGIFNLNSFYAIFEYEVSLRYQGRPNIQVKRGQLKSLDFGICASNNLLPKLKSKISYV